MMAMPERIELSTEDLMAMMRTAYLEGFADGVIYLNAKAEDRWTLSSVYRRLMTMLC